MNWIEMFNCRKLTFMVNNTINKSIHSGRVPDDIKLAKVIPIYKAKDKELLSNYRPISLLPTTSKILEKKCSQKAILFVGFSISIL